MRRKNMWAGRLTAILLCTVLSAEPIAIYAEDFSDGIANTEMQDKTEIPESTESYQNAESQVDADPESLSDEFESPEQDFECIFIRNPGCTIRRCAICRGCAKWNLWKERYMDSAEWSINCRGKRHNG